MSDPVTDIEISIKRIMGGNKWRGTIVYETSIAKIAVSADAKTPDECRLAMRNQLTSIVTILTKALCSE